MNVVWESQRHEEEPLDQEAGLPGGFYAQIGPDGRPGHAWSWTLLRNGLDGTSDEVTSGWGNTEDEVKAAAVAACTELLAAEAAKPNLRKFVVQFVRTVDAAYEVEAESAEDAEKRFLLEGEEITSDTMNIEVTSIDEGDRDEVLG